MSKWTDEEIRILKENYASKQIDALLQLLPSRRVSSIYSKAFDLRLRKPSKPRLENPVEAQKSHGESQPQKVKSIEKPCITKILPYERQVILELGKFLPILELKMLLPRRSAKDILQLLDYYHMR